MVNSKARNIKSRFVGENSYSNICVTTSGEQKYAASESGLAVSLFGKCLDF